MFLGLVNWCVLRECLLVRKVMILGLVESRMTGEVFVNPWGWMQRAKGDLFRYYATDLGIWYVTRWIRSQKQ